MEIGEGKTTKVNSMRVGKNAQGHQNPQEGKSGVGEIASGGGARPHFDDEGDQEGGQEDHQGGHHSKVENLRFFFLFVCQEKYDHDGGGKDERDKEYPGRAGDRRAGDKESHGDSELQVRRVRAALLQQGARVKQRGGEGQKAQRQGERESDLGQERSARVQQEELESLEDPNEAKEKVAGALSAVFGGKNRLGGTGGGEHVFVFEFHQRDTSQVQQEKYERHTVEPRENLRKWNSSRTWAQTAVNFLKLPSSAREACVGDWGSLTQKIGPPEES